MQTSDFSRQHLSNELSSFYSPDEVYSIYFWFDDAQKEGIPKSDLLLFLERLKTGEPVQFIFGYTPFYKSKFLVDKHTLIPRPETEELVDIILNLFPVKNTKNQKLNILDIGTGSGCIALSLLKERPNWTATGIDVSENALIIARKNATNLGLDPRFQAVQMDYLNQKMNFSSFDIIVSNPPYIPLDEKIKMDKRVVNYEPHLALFVDSDPVIFYRKIANDLMKSDLQKIRGIFLETHQHFNYETLKLFQPFEYGFTQIKKIEDFSGNPRFIQILKN